MLENSTVRRDVRSYEWDKWDEEDDDNVYTEDEDEEEEE